MRTGTSYFKTFSKMMWLFALLLVVFTAGCDRDHGGLLLPGGDSGPAGAVNLGTAGTYGIMATASIEYQGTVGLLTVIYGDVALNPGTSITGFVVIPNLDGVNTSTQVTGTIHIRDAVAIQAQADLLAAYNDLTARSAPAAAPLPTVNGGTFAAGNTNLSGMVLLPGVYRAGAMAAGADTYSLSDPSTGPLVLDGGGNSGAVFVFQSGGISTTDGTVLLRNGARATNVYWVTTQDATIGNGVGFFQGTIVSARDITVNQHVQGRMLAGAILNGALVITGNHVISVPAP